MKIIAKQKYLKPQVKLVVLPQVALMQTSGEPTEEEPTDDELLEFTNDQLANPGLIVY